MKRAGFGRQGLGSERGSGGVELALAAAFVLIPFTLLLASLPIQLEYRSMADAAAREAVRACATAHAPDTGQTRAVAVARRILGERGLSPSGQPQVSVDCQTAWGPGREVRATVTLDAPAIRILDTWTVASWTITADYKERMETYRSIPKP